MIWAGAMMIDFLGNGDANYRAAHDAIVNAIETVLLQGPKTPDLGGSANTTEVGKAIAAAI
jgi:tartrate dehydrogenase/decarboxylase/D-malate dehydrogenase